MIFMEGVCEPELIPYDTFMYKTVNITQDGIWRKIVSQIDEINTPNIIYKDVRSVI